jgi:hypothetical protein
MVPVHAQYRRALEDGNGQLILDGTDAIADGNGGFFVLTRTNLFHQTNAGVQALNPPAVVLPALAQFNGVPMLVGRDTLYAFENGTWQFTSIAMDQLPRKGRRTGKYFLGGDGNQLVVLNLQTKTTQLVQDPSGTLYPFALNFLGNRLVAAHDSIGLAVSQSGYHLIHLHANTAQPLVFPLPTLSVNAVGGLSQDNQFYFYCQFPDHVKFFLIQGNAIVYAGADTVIGNAIANDFNFVRNEWLIPKYVEGFLSVTFPNNQVQLVHHETTLHQNPFSPKLVAISPHEVVCFKQLLGAPSSALVAEYHYFGGHGLFTEGFSGPKMELRFRDLGLQMGAPTSVPNGPIGRLLFSEGLELFGKHNGTEADYFWSYFFPSGATYGPASARYKQADYAKAFGGVFKMSQGAIAYHLNHYQDPGYTMAPEIAHWPGNGEGAYSEQARLAPFKDLNGNDLYEPMLGEYPDIQGDFAFFTITNGFQGTHHALYGKIPLPIEVHRLTEIFPYNPDTMLQQVVVNRYRLFNPSNSPIDSLQAGLAFDPDITMHCEGTPNCNNATRFLSDTARHAFFGFSAYVNPSGTGIWGGMGTIVPDHPLEVVIPFQPVHPDYRDGLNPNGLPFLDSTGNILSPWVNPMVGDTAVRQLAGIYSEDTRVYSKTQLGTLAPNQTICFNNIAFYTKAKSPDIHANFQAYTQMADYLNNWWDGLSTDPCQQASLEQSESQIPPTVARVYPNPSTGDFWLDAPAEGRYAVVDLSGRLVASGEAIAGVNRVRLPKQAGAYVLRLEMGHTVSFHKLLVQP